MRPLRRPSSPPAELVSRSLHALPLRMLQVVITREVPKCRTRGEADCSLSLGSTLMFTWLTDSVATRSYTCVVPSHFNPQHQTPSSRPLLSPPTAATATSATLDHAYYHIVAANISIPVPDISISSCKPTLETDALRHPASLPWPMPRQVPHGKNPFLSVSWPSWPKLPSCPRLKPCIRM